MYLVGFTIKKFVTMHGHMNVKIAKNLVYKILHMLILILFVFFSKYYLGDKIKNDKVVRTWEKCGLSAMTLVRYVKETYQMRLIP